MIIQKSIQNLVGSMETNSAETLDNSTKNTVINKQNEEINLLSLSVVRRDGSITPFKSDKIANAIRKAFLAQTDLRDSKQIDKSVSELTETVTAALTRRIANGDMIHIEDIQDQVELALMRGEHHKVARAYVCLLYTSPSPRDSTLSRMPSSA